MPKLRTRRKRTTTIEEGQEYIHTWLPYASLSKSVECLSASHLSNQRIHNWQLISLLCYSTLNFDADLTACVWANHPIVLQWKNHLALLMQYQRIVCRRYGSGQVNVLEQCEQLFEPVVEAGLAEADTDIVPAWLGNENYHTSQQSNMLRLEPEHYTTHFPNVESNLSYVFPRN